MKRIITNSLSAGLLFVAMHAATAQCPPALDFYKRPLAAQEPVHLCDLMGGQVVLVVNTASRCAYTPQYEGLEELYERFRAQGLVVAGFPSNDFAGQEPGNEQQIQNFCRNTYAVRFPMFEKVRVTGKAADPFYQYLAGEAGEAPRWNFHKYLLDRQGRLVASFPSQVTPQDPRLVERIQDLL
jgi:glutathione peroxidase